jgi:GNAT superfamily N-acetyltransferase
MDGSGTRVSIREVGAMEGYHLVEHHLEDHYHELAKFKELAKLKPDLERYQRVEADGRFIGLVAELDNHVIGYSANFLQTNMHYSELAFCQNDVLYVAPGHRKGRAGFALIHHTIELARERGAKLMLWHAKENTDLHRLLLRHGYEVLDIILAKEI